MDETTKAQLRDQFERYLDELPEPLPEGAADEGAGAEGMGDEGADLFTLFSELAGLKSEVKRESRQVKTALDQFRDVFGTLRTSQETLSRELDRSREEHPAQLRQELRQELRPLLLELLELRDRMAAGLAAVRRHAFSRWSGLCVPEVQLVEGMAEGQAMVLRRFDKLLAAREVHPIEACGKPIDLRIMQATEVVARDDLPSGTVTEEVRTGYTWRGEVLRTAEVVVNKRPG